VAGVTSLGIMERTSLPQNLHGTEPRARADWTIRQLGIFLCMRCAAIHRKLGTHISKVKSLSMDSWSNEQVEVRNPVMHDPARD